ncbi:death on curing protein [Haloarcula vallismortis]|uniref:Death on curing protein n=1 Tax=Haloarcula vallismortis TaxID=28442 RepID=A0A1H2SLU2_HALVA|nr:death on curing protein [Haloarcula vallismortis]
MTDDIAYPSVELVFGLHEQIVGEGEITEPGVRSEDAVASALQYISEGFFGEVPETIHHKAVHLMRLLVAELRSSTETSEQHSGRWWSSI